MADLALTFVSACLGLQVGLVASACVNQYADPLAAESANPECGTDALAKLIAGRAEEMSRVCRPSPVKTCATILKQPVIDKWKPRFDAWEQCK